MRFIFCQTRRKRQAYEPFYDHGSDGVHVGLNLELRNLSNVSIDQVDNY